MSTTRNSRPLATLRPGAVALDDRPLRRLLADTPATTALFNYYDTTGAPSATWDRFYRDIALVRYAGLAEIDPAREADTNRDLLNRLQGQDKTFHFDPKETLQLAAVRALVSRLLRLYRRLDSDAAAFATFPAEVAFASMLRRAIKQVFAVDYRAVSPWQHWLETDLDRRVRALPRDPWGEPDSNGDRKDPLVLYRAAWSTQSALAQVVQQAQSGFAARAAQPAGLTPHFALYLAFLRQFAGAQAALNTLPTRHRDFFYRDVLGLRPAPAAPDAAFVGFLAAPGSATDLPAGTQLTAGKDASGLPIVYALATDTGVSPSAIAQQATLWIGPNPSDPAAAFKLARFADAGGVSWAPLGARQDSGLPADAPTAGADTQVGFALSSPTLQLEEGTRTVTITLAFAPPVATAASLGPGQLSYSGAKGWVPVDPTTVTFTPSAAGAPPGLVIEFTLPSAAPPCVNYDPAILGPGFDPRVPVLRVIFAHPLAALDPASAAAPVASVTIAVEVKGVQNLVLSGVSGKLTPGKPLPLFGSPPQPAAALYIGSVEVFRKQLSALALHATWQGLPGNSTDLQSYFAPYLMTLTLPDHRMFRSDQYGVTLDAMVGGSSVSLPLTAPGLFPAPAAAAPTAPATNPPLPGSTWTAQPADLAKVPPAPALAAPLAYSPQSGPGFLRLVLAAPDYLFGQPLYQAVFAKIAAHNAVAMMTNAGRPQPKGSPPPARSPRTAFGILKTPAKLGVFESLKHFLWPPAKPPLTLPPELFDVLHKIESLPAVARMVEAAGGVKAADLPAALATLAGQRFTDLASLRQLIIGVLRLDPKHALAMDAVELILHGLAHLVLPQTPAPDDGDATTPAPDASGGNNLVVPLLPPPPPPLIPTAASLTLDYSAAVTFTLPGPTPPAGPAPAPPSWDRLWHLSPFATYPVAAGQPVLPAFPAGGQLYLGLSGVEPPETLSLLFVLESLSASRLAALGPTAAQPLGWACLEGDTWHDATPAGTGAATASDFSTRNVSDGTFGFQRTGIVRVELPRRADTVHTVMPSGLVWLRISAPDPGTRLRVVQLLSHAASAVWVPPAGATPGALAAHFASPLPAGALNALVVPDPSVAAIAQPLPSAGGAPAEDDEAFTTRVSERLRHKGRAVAAPDYERLLLANYPAVFSARVLAPFSPATAGRVALVVLPVVKTVPADPPPVFAPGDLDAMSAGLQALAPPTSTVQILNPDYEWLTISMAVAFPPDRSFQAYAAQLSTDLDAFISPWIYRQADVIQPRLSFQLSELTDFISRLDYVELSGPCTVTARDPAGNVLDTWTNQAAVADPLIAPRSAAAMLVGVAWHDLTPWQDNTP